jgi:hypothetical protein
MAAHSGLDKLEHAQSYILLTRPDDEHVAIRVATSRLQPDFAWSDEESERFDTLLTHAIQKVGAKYEKQTRYIVETALQESLHFWFNAAGKDDPVNMDSLKMRSAKR